MNIDDMERLAKYADSITDKVPEEIKKLVEMVDFIPKLLIHAYQHDEKLGETILAGIIGTTLITAGKNLDDSIRLHNVLMEQVRGGIERVDIILSKGEE